MATKITLKPPPNLNDDAIEEWKRILSDLRERNQLEKTDRSLLNLYIQTWQIWNNARISIGEHGIVQVYNNGVTTGLSHHVKVYDSLTSKLHKLLVDLGLTKRTQAIATPRALEF